MAKSILILGGTGTVGAKLAAGLRAAGETVRIASRKGGTDETVRFEFTDPATFAPAFEGVDRVFILSPSGHADQLGMVGPVLDFAAARKVKVVLQTALGVNASDDIPFRQLELRLERSGTPFVILRPNWFSDNFGGFWLGQIRAGEIRLPAGEGRTSFIDARDIAAVAAAVLTTDAFDGQALDLTGPEALTYAEAAKLIAEATGKPVGYRAVADGEFVGDLVAHGVAPDYAAMLAAIFHPVREGWAAAVTDTVARVTGRAPRPLPAFIADNAALLRA